MNILHVYMLSQDRPRSTAVDHLFSFRRYGRGAQIYLNLAMRKVPTWMQSAEFDAVVYHTSFFSQRWGEGTFEAGTKLAEPLRGVGRVRVALPQDEFMKTNLLTEFINEFEIDHVFTLAGESARSKIYAGVDRDRVGLSQVLPGYLSDHTRKRIDRIVARTQERPIDVGYRAWPGAPWLGRHALLKGEVGSRTEEMAPAHGLTVDVSARDSEVFTGDSWFQFLASCKYTVGCEGGAGMHDPDGQIRIRTERFMAQHPDAGFDEIEAACFPGLDGNLDYFAIGPRHIEACATRTCQVLVEGDYQGVLRPEEHYIPVKRDLSDLDRALELVEQDQLRSEITERAYRDVIESGRYSYQSLVRTVERVTTMSEEPASGRPAAAIAVRAPVQRAADGFSRLRIVYLARVWPHLHRAKHRIVTHRLYDYAVRYSPHRLLPAAWARLMRSIRRRHSGT